MALKRHGLWRNDARNRQIARIARAARDGSDLTNLLGRPAAALGPPGPTSVLVIVENLEHALNLMPKLPGWPVVHQCSNFDGIDPAAVTELARRIPDPTSSPGCAIVTLTALAHPDFRAGQFSIAILACGGSKLPELPKSMFLEALDKPSSLVHVDIYDRHHRDLARASRKRQRAYRERGWAAPGREPALQHAADFLYKRVGGRQ